MADRQQREAAEAAQPVSVFRITQDGRTDCLLTEGTAAMDVFHTALRLRFYLLAKGNSSQWFSQTISAAGHIAPEVFQDYANEVREHTGRVVAALESIWTRVSSLLWTHSMVGRTTRSETYAPPCGTPTERTA